MKRIVGDRHRGTVYPRAEYLRFTFGLHRGTVYPRAEYLRFTFGLNKFDRFRFGILKI